MIRRKPLALGIFLTLLFLLIAIQTTAGPIETPFLIVRDATGQFSDEQVKRLAQVANQTLEQILAFWSVKPRIEDYGKIRVECERRRTDFNSAVFHWGKEEGRKTRIVSLFGVDGDPHMLAQKLTHAIFPNPDKLIRNMMGLSMEVRFGNYLSFPMCGFSNDAWVLALRQIKSYIPLEKLGPEHEDWGMGTKGGLPIVKDKAKQHVAYTESGSFGDYLLNTHGAEKVKEFNKLSHKKKRPWVEVFGLTPKELEANWIQALDATQKKEEQTIPILIKLLKANPDRACREAQDVAMKTIKK